MSTNGKAQHTQKADFRKARLSKTVTVYVPDLESEFTITRLPAHVALETMEENIRNPADKYWLEKRMAWSIVNPATLEAIYDPDNPEDLVNLAQMTVEMRNPIIEAMADLNGWSKKAIAETEKNSSASQTTDSASV